MSRPESPEARAARILAELRDATREAAGVLKDLQKVYASARGQVEEYLHAEVESALQEYEKDLISTVRAITGRHEEKVKQRVIDFAALIENNFSREALIQEAANRIEAQITPFIEQASAANYHGPGGVVINLCTRPHAD